jgi:hypothetical protein
MVDDDKEKPVRLAADDFTEPVKVPTPYISEWRVGKPDAGGVIALTGITEIEDGNEGEVEKRITARPYTNMPALMALCDEIIAKKAAQ